MAIIETFSSKYRGLDQTEMPQNQENHQGADNHHDPNNSHLPFVVP